MSNEESKQSSCGGSCGSCGHSCGEDMEARRLKERLMRIKHKIVVMSGKGGVGKSTVAVNLAQSLAAAGKTVGLLDIDVHGPSIPTMLNVQDAQIESDEAGLKPLVVGTIKAMSIGFLLKNRDDALIWRGPMKINMIRQFLADVVWGDLDYLIVDAPPGTGDEPLSVCQYLGDFDGAIVVTTPQEVAAADVRKSINFCQKVGVNVLGVVENMSGFTCPCCSTVTPIFKTEGGKIMAEQFHVPFLGSIPLEPALGAACDSGISFVQTQQKSPAAQAFAKIVETILA